MSDIASAIPPLSRHAAARDYRGRGPEERLIERTTLPQVLAGIPAHGGPSLTWYEAERRVLHFDAAELPRQVRALAHWFARGHGITRGDRVIVLSANSPEAFATHLALMSLGAVTVPVSNTESPRVLQLIADKVTPRLVVTSREVSAELLAARPGGMVALPALPLAADGDAGFEWPARDVMPDDPAVILFTSGTTSAPKGVCLSHYNLLVNAEGLARVHDLARRRVHMCVLPLFHANAFGFSMVASLYAGSHVVLSAGLPGAAVWDILRTERVDVISLVPEIIRVLSRMPVPRDTLPDLKYVTSAAAPLPKTVAREFVDRTGIPIHQGYGLSECVNFAATIPWDAPDADLERSMGHWAVPSIGPALFGCDIDIRRADGSPAGAEEEGEIVVTGHTLMRGYWDAEDATGAALGEGALRTGDLGFFALVGGERYIFVTGRKKEIVIRYGENLSPLAIEAELEALRAVGRFAVTGFPNEAAGEEIGLYLVVPRTPDNERKVLDAVKACSVRYRPRVVLFGADPIPATPTGKVKRAVLAQRFQSYAKRNFGSEPVVGP
ncbi:class I adenylate-forming enzyme family protein [Corallococcus exiguus]|uniref:class I adenylate-forming enzyme family protein n=1 Tax=Corallococcus exiguus TaxID=83462 RepID=UPI0014949FD4|nr:class I adenylate-forming enzyme family protein [Corallococcus exiguus]NPD24869.1 acyl--CoA ligase [Corallococcus exiguus]